jgi:hypothetical protein
VRVSDDGTTTAIAAQNLVNNDFVCVTPATKILWFTSEDKSTLKVTFTTHPFAPGTNATFQGNEGHDPVGGGAVALGCNQYAVTHCTKNGAVCAKTLDPKVIVTSTVIESESPPKRENEDKK